VPPFPGPNRLRLENLNAFRLQAFGSLDHAELDRLAFLQGAKTARLDGGEMHEYIFAGLTGDKTKTLGIVKPLHCTLFHFVYSSTLFVAE